MEALLDRLLRHDPRPKPTADVAAWWSTHKRRGGATRPIDDATYGGFSADRVAFAFAAGYHAALRALVPSLSSDHLTALCATEEGGVHPKAIKSTLVRKDEGWELNGKKKWATLADVASAYLVVVSIGTGDEGRNRLRVVRVPRDRKGLTITPMTETPFAPEVHHAELSFDAVPIVDDDVLPGDGFDRYLKPFRTVEDLHVHGALLGHLVAMARRYGFPQETLEGLLAAIVGVCGLADDNPIRPTVHVALAGVLDVARKSVEACTPYFDRLEPEVRERWERDRALFQVAERTRGERRAAAWRALDNAIEGGGVSSETATTKR